jgi:hypothetical protein
MATQPRAADTLTFPADEVRPSDAERDEVIGRLRASSEQGRLDVAELSERLDKVYAARARRELAALLGDLPGDPAARAPAPAPEGPLSGSGYPSLAARAGGYVAISLLLVTIWALSGMGAFWPIWFIAFGAFGMLGRPGHGWGHCGHGRRRRRSEVVRTL